MQVGGGHVLNVMGEGTVAFKSPNGRRFLVHSVLYIPDSRVRLLSTLHLAHQLDVKSTFGKTDAEVWAVADKAVWFTAAVTGKPGSSTLFLCDLKPDTAYADCTSTASQPDKTTAQQPTALALAAAAIPSIPTQQQQQQS